MVQAFQLFDVATSVPSDPRSPDRPSPQFVVALVSREQVLGDRQATTMAALLCPRWAYYTLVPGRQTHITGSDGNHCRFRQKSVDLGATHSASPALSLLNSFVVAGAQLYPRDQMTGGRKAAHLHPDFRHEGRIDSLPRSSQNTPPLPKKGRSPSRSPRSVDRFLVRKSGWR